MGTVNNRDTQRKSLTESIAAALGIDPGGIDPHERLAAYGLDSLSASRIVAELSVRLGRELPATLAWDCPTIHELEQYLADPRRSAPRAASPMPPQPTMSGEVAVIGMSCRFPKAPNVAAFWHLLVEGIDAITEVPAQRWDLSHLYDRDPDAPGKMNTKWGGFLADVDRFEPQFFAISPREAVEMDPQQRLMLELAWEALEDAGVAPHTLRNSRTGVFAGAMWSDYARVQSSLNLPSTQHTATGQDLSIISARLSYTLGLRGPSLTINTACSSALVAVHYARLAVLRRECALALAGGVNLLLSPDSTIAMTKFGGLSPDGRCKTFDASANGYVRSEGGGIVVLKELSRALLDGDRIYAVIRGSAVNNDGFSNGLSAPSAEAQELLLLDAYADARVDPREVQFVEAHGTGTKLGDPIEASALGAVLGAGRSPTHPLLIGSAKTNIGHLEPAAGIAGLIKTCLALHHRLIPPNLHFLAPNPHIDFAKLNLQVASAPTPWPGAPHQALAGVSAFGFGGTNSHVVLGGSGAATDFTLPLAAEDLVALRAKAARLRDGLSQSATELTLADLSGLCQWAQEGPSRLALTTHSRARLLEGLDAYLNDRPYPGLLAGSAREHRTGPVFVFSGSGGEWQHMATELIGLPSCRQALLQCDEALAPLLGGSLLATLVADDAGWMDDIARVQPALFMIQVALASLLAALGISPGAVLGHSTGEVAAAFVAGCLSLEEAAKIICARSQQLCRISGQGAMAVVELSAAETEVLLADGEKTGVSISGYLSPGATTVSGTPATISELLALAKRHGARVHRIRINYASHCGQVEPLLPAIETALGELHPQSGAVPFYSAAHGGQVNGKILVGTNWSRSERAPIQFQQAVQQVIADGYDTFLEVAPHAILRLAIEQCLGSAGRSERAIPLMLRQQPATQSLQAMAGALFVSGYAVHGEPLSPFGTVPAVLSDRPGLADTEQARPQPRRERAVLLPFSARSRSALAEQARQLARFVDERAELPLHDIIYTAAARRSHHQYRAAVVGSSRQQLISQLETVGQGAGETAAPIPHRESEPRVVFVFPGQGTQWPGMARDLIAEEPLFRDHMVRCSQALAAYTGWSLIDEITRPSKESRLDETRIAQPALFAVEAALAMLLLSWGVTPVGIIGHSVGEVTAAYVSGALTLEEAIRLVYLRSSIMQKATGKGGMLAVAAAARDARKELHDLAERVDVAAENSPSSCVLAGDTAALDTVHARLRQRGVQCRELRVNYAFHSPQMEPLHHELSTALGRIELRAPRIPIYSTVLGRALAEQPLDPAYWGKNMRQKVRFAHAVAAATKDLGGKMIFLELGPHPALVSSIEECLAAQHDEGMAVPTLWRQQPGRQCLLHALASLYKRGLSLAWQAVCGGPGRVVSLPAYPFQRERYFLESAQASARPAVDGSGHPLLGRFLTLASPPETCVWEAAHGVANLPAAYHCVLHGEHQRPWSLIVEMARSAAKELYLARACVLEDLFIQRSLHGDAAAPRTLQFIATGSNSGSRSFTLASRAPSDSAWSTHATGTLNAVANPAPDEPLGLPPASQVKATTGAAQELYRTLSVRGISFAPGLTPIVKLWTKSGAAVAELRPSQAERGSNSETLAALPLLEALPQLATALLLARAGDGIFLPTSASKISILQDLSAAVSAYVRVGTWGTDLQAAEVDGWLLDASGKTVVMAQGLKMELAAQPGELSRTAAQLFKLDWQPVRPALPNGHATGGPILLLGDAGSLADELTAKLRSRGVAVQRQTPSAGQQPGALSALLAQRPFSAVVHLSSGDCPLGDATSEAALERVLHRDCGALFELMHLANAHAPRPLPRLYIVTRGVHDIEAAPRQEPVALGSAMLWGLRRTILYEHPEFGCTAIDLSPTVPGEELATLAAILHAGSESDELALRGGQCFVAYLAPAGRMQPDSSSAAVRQNDLCKQQATYVITGGLGGLGLVFAKWLVQNGARHLLLLGRGGVTTEHQRSEVAALQKRGAVVSVVRANVADRPGLEAALNKAMRGLPPIKGVIHAAGLLRAGLLADQDGTQLAELAEAKARGAWNLHLLTRELPLDFFVLFSSISALLGSPGLGSYAAVNCFLDGLAHHRRRCGLPALSVNWGAFSDVGAVADAQQLTWLAARGIHAISPQEGCEALGHILRAGMTQVGYLAFNFQECCEYYPQLATSSLYSRLTVRPSQVIDVKPTSAAVSDEVIHPPPAVRRAMLETDLAHLVGQVLHMAAERVDRYNSLCALGMNSLMLLELRSLLRNRLGLELSLVVTVTLKELSIVELAACLTLEADSTNNGESGEWENAIL